MRTHTLSLGMGLLASALALAAGCGVDDAIDFTDVPLAVDDGKADVYVPGQGYTWVRPLNTRIACIRTPCPNAVLQNVNTDQTELSYAYDWRALRLKVDESAALEANAGKMLLYGKYATAKMRGESVQIYQVTRANPRVAEQSVDSPEADRYYMVKSSDPACQVQPCAYSALLMNQPQKEQWSDLDLSRLGLPQNARQILVSDLQKGSAYVSIERGSAMPVVVTEAFRSFNATPLPNS